jgi:cytochrome P450
MTLFATFPQQWDHLRADPSLVGNAVEEVLRYLPVTPLLTRLNTEPMTFDGVEIAERT